MVDVGGIGELIGGGTGIGNVGQSLSGLMIAFYYIVPIIAVSVVAAISVWIAYLMVFKFKYVVYVHSMRAEGYTIKKKTRGGFFVNRKTKAERLVLFSNYFFNQIFIPTIPNYLIKLENGKQVIHLLKTTGREFIPISVKENRVYLESKKGIGCENCEEVYIVDDFKGIEKCPKCNSEKIARTYVLQRESEFIVHPELVKDWFEIASNEDTNKYKITGFLAENQQFILYISAWAVILIVCMFLMGQVENAINMARSAATTCKGQVVSMGLGFLPFIFRRFKKWK